MTKEEVKKRMYLCAEHVSKYITKWNKGGSVWPDLTWPVVSLEHLDQVIDWVYDNYADKVIEGQKEIS